MRNEKNRSDRIMTTDEHKTQLTNGATGRTVCEITESDSTLLQCIKVFCSPESTRYNLESPFVQDGFLCGTDSRVAVWVSCDLPNTTDKRHPKMSVVMDNDTKCNLQWPVVELACARCGGNGTAKTTRCFACDGDKTCPECEGAGYEECFHCGHETDCDDCDGTGKCGECDGTGFIPEYECECDECEYRYIDFEQHKLSVSLARKIATLPGVRYAIDQEQECIVFESSNGIRGKAMFSKERK